VAQLLPTGKKTKRTDIVLSIYGSSDVKLLTKSGEIKQFPSMARLLPTGKTTNHSLTSELPYIDRRMSVRFVVFPVSSCATEGNYLISPDSTV
jgi:hypothetical protein